MAVMTTLTGPPRRTHAHMAAIAAMATQASLAESESLRQKSAQLPFPHLAPATPRQLALCLDSLARRVCERRLEAAEAARVALDARLVEMKSDMVTMTRL